MSNNELNGHIFISHSSRDATIINRIRDWLIELGLDPWVSSMDISDQFFEKNIARQLASCKFFLLVLSSYSLASDHVLNEVCLASNKKKKIFIYSVEDAKIPDEIELTLSRIQQIRHYEHPVDSLERLAKQLLKESGIGDSEALTTIESASLAFKERRHEEDLKHQLKLQEWRDSYWNRKWRNGRVTKELARLDRDALDEIACELGLTKDETKLASKGRRDRKAFNHSLDSLLKRPEVTRYDVYVVEKRRIQFQVSQKEVRELVARRQFLPIVKEAGGRKVPDYPVIEWFETLLNQRRKHLEEIHQARIESKSEAHKESSRDASCAKKSSKVSLMATVYSDEIKVKQDYSLDLVDRFDNIVAAPNEEPVKRNGGSEDIPKTQGVSSTSSVTRINKQKTDLNCDHPNERLSQCQDSLDEYVGSVQPSNCSDNTNSVSAHGVIAGQSSNSELSDRSPSYLYALQDLPSSLRHPVSILVHEIADSHPSLTNLMTSSETVKRQTAALFNIHKDHSNKLIMLATLCEENGFERQILVSTTYLSISGQRSTVLPYHFPLVIENPARRIVMTTHDISVAIAFSYSPKLGLSERCSQISPTTRIFSKEKSRLFKWLLILLESNYSGFSDATNLTSNDLSYGIEVIQSGNFQALDHISRRSSKASINKNQLSKKQSNQPLTLDNKCSSDLEQLGDSRASYLRIQRSYISKLSKADINGRLFRMFHCFSKPSRLQFGERIASDPTYLKMLALHRLKGLQGFKPLLYYSAGNFRVKRGFILFDKGISLLTFFTEPRLFLFGTEEFSKFCSFTVENKGLRVELHSLSFSASNDHKKNSQSVYCFEYLEGIDDVELFASSLKRVIEQLNEFRLTFSRLKDSICAEARELLYFKSVDLGSNISMFDLPEVAGTSSLPLDILNILMAAKLFVPHVSDVLLSIKSEGSGFTSLILIAIDGVSMLFSNGNSAKGKHYKWSNLHSLTYRHQCGSGNSEFVVNNGGNGFAFQWAHRNTSQYLFKELASFILSLAKRFRDQF